MRRVCSFLAVLACLFGIGTEAAFAQAGVSFMTNPRSIAINALYNGTSLTITGEVPAGSQVLVRLVGESSAITMKEKGKVLGLLWMNRDKVTFGQAPKVFLVAASPELPAEALAKHGVSGLAERISVASADGDKAALVAEFLKYQQTEKLYQQNAGEVTLGQDAGDARSFSATLRVPSRLSPGAYSVEVLAVKGDAVVARSETAIAASFVGAPAFLADLAFGHGTFYGIMASVIAILGGLVVSQIFRGSKSGAH